MLSYEIVSTGWGHHRIFRHEEFATITALSGKEGLALLAESRNVGVIISDQRMPGMLGSDFLHLCRSVAPDAIRILLTGYADLNASIDAVNKGELAHYFSKPWNIDELLTVVRDAVQQYSLLLNNRRLDEVIRRQNEELQEWNQNLKTRVLQQTSALRRKIEERSLLLKRNKESDESLVAALAGTLTLRSESLFQHACNVSKLSLTAAQELGVTGELLETIRIAALLHDIGKIGFPERMLRLPPDKLSSRELQQYNLHAVKGQTAIDMFEKLRPAGILIRHHHERFDGGGLPDNLTGGSIPYGSRIITFADFIDNALFQRTEISLDFVLDQARQLGGALLDPRMQQAFERVAGNIYGRDAGRPTQDDTEREISPLELQNGMILNRGIYSESGALLLEKGAVVDDGLREAILRFHKKNPTKVFVLVK